MIQCANMPMCQLAALSLHCAANWHIGTLAYWHIGILAHWHIGTLANYSLFLKQESVPFAISPYQSYQCDTKIEHKSELLRLDVEYRRLEEIDNKRTE